MIYNFTTIADYLKIEKSFIDSLESETAIAALENEEVIYQSEDVCNIDYLKEHHITHFKFNFQCRCIVAAKGNVMLVIKRPHKGGESLVQIFSKAFCEYLNGRGLDSAVCDNNDIMVDGYKTASAVQSEIKNWDFICFQISINQDIETIKNVCKKPMIKIPRGLGEYGITTEEILQFCTDYWSKH